MAFFKTAKTASIYIYLWVSGLRNVHHAIEWVRARLRKSDVLEQYYTYSLINESMINELLMFLGIITLGNQIGELFNTSFLETII